MDKGINPQVPSDESELLAFHRKEQRRKVRNYREMNRIAQKGQILFTGSSLMEHSPIAEYCLSSGMDKVIYNRGVSGTTTDQFLAEIDTALFDLEPSKVFINIGTNDINARSDGEYWQDHLLKNYEEILRQTKPAPCGRISRWRGCISMLAATQTFLML